MSARLRSICMVRTETMLLDRAAPGDAARARELIAAGLAEAEQIGMPREIVRFERLRERLDDSAPMPR